LGDQDARPPSMQNRATNKFYMLPLILGLLGIFYQYNKGREGKRGLWLVFLLL